MREREFQYWLAQVYVTRRRSRMSAGSQASIRSMCRTVEKYEGDLDEHVRRDGLASLLGRLKYSTSDKAAGRAAAHAIPIDGNVHAGSASYRTGVRLYRVFSQAWPQGRPRPAPVQAPDAKPGSASGTAGQAAWPEWQQLADADLLVQARVVARFVRFVKPEIAAAVAEDNEKHAAAWGEALGRLGIDARLWLWPGNACTFPGVRRYSGSKEIKHYWAGGWKGKHRPSDALLLDDNTYPKHLWSFVMRGRPFQNFGPTGYALAHLLDHKPDTRRLRDEVVVSKETDLEGGLPGLYTSATNAAFVPTGMLRPTDFEGNLRGLLQRRAAALYGGVCAPLPPGVSMAPAASNEWDVEAFEWAEPVGDEAHVGAFLAWRAEKLAGLLDVANETGQEAATPTSFEVHGPEGEGERFDLWSDERLSFEKKGTHEAMRVAIRSGLERMKHKAGRVLRGELETAEDLEGADIENILVYNVHAPGFRELTHEGLLLERRRGEPRPAPSGEQRPYHHIYELVSPDAAPRHWTRQDRSASWRGVRLAFLPSDPAQVWAAMHETGFEAPAMGKEPPAAFAIDLTVSAPVGTCASSIVKVLVDGVLSALHAHDGSQMEDVVMRLASRLPVTGEQVAAWLAAEGAAPLGKRRLLWTRGNGIQWNPADDRCVALAIRMETSAEAQDGLVIRGDIFRVEEQTEQAALGA